MTQEDLFASDVYDYWRERAGVVVRSPKVKDKTLTRIRARLADGFAPDELKRCVDFALHTDFYYERGYHRDPAVIWRNTERVHSILERVRAISSRPLPL